MKVLGGVARGAALLVLLLAGSLLAALEGVVSGREGEALAGIEVGAYGERGADGERALLARGESDAQGRFNLAVADGAARLVTLTGAAGTGRVVVREQERELALSYPVRTTVVIMHDNDLHFNINFRDQLERNLAAARERYENVFLFNAGDAIQFSLTRARNRAVSGLGPGSLLGGLALTKKGPEAITWVGSELTAPFAIVRDEDSKTTTYEWIIPLERYKLREAAGETIGFNLAILDDNRGKGRRRGLS